MSWRRLFFINVAVASVLAGYGLIKTVGFIIEDTKYRSANNVCQSIYTPGQRLLLLDSEDKVIMLGLSACGKDHVLIRVGMIEAGFKLTLNESLVGPLDDR